MIPFLIIFLRLALAIVLGGAIGLEREFHEHRAGMRTNALVALGSALFTLVSAYGFLDLLTIAHVQIDPTRVASYIVAGIGFLGAGAIGVQKTGARGLTTAAAIWTVAAIGMACGVGFYWEAVAATILTLIVLRVLRFIELRLLPGQAHVIYRVRLDPGHTDGMLMERIYDICTRRGLSIQTLSTHQNGQGDLLEITCRHARAITALRILDEIRRTKGVLDGNLDLQEVEKFELNQRSKS